MAFCISEVGAESFKGARRSKNHTLTQAFLGRFQTTIKVGPINLKPNFEQKKVIESTLEKI